MGANYQSEIKDALLRLHADGYAQFRIDAFEQRARAGKWSQAWRILNKTICGARKSDGSICLAGWRHNMRCRWHGGGTPTPGPTTQAGRDRIAAAQRERWRRWHEKRGEILGSTEGRK